MNTKIIEYYGNTVFIPKHYFYHTLYIRTGYNETYDFTGIVCQRIILKA